MSGFFIALEGPDGSGKSTQAKALAQELSERGYKTVLTREPGGTDIGQKIRAILLDPLHKEMSQRAELFLYLADRAQHCEQLIMPALQSGAVVVTDRFMDATNAYQGYGRNLGVELTQTLNAIAVQDALPDLTLMMLINPEEGIKRAHQKRQEFGVTGDRIEREAIDFHKRLLEGCRALAGKYPERITAIDALRPIDEIAANNLAITLRKLSEANVDTSEQLAFRPAREEDIPAIYEISHAAFAPDAGLLGLTPETAPNLRAFETQRYIHDCMKGTAVHYGNNEPEKHEIFVGEYNGEIAATASYKNIVKKHSLAEIERLAVAAKHRGRKFGRQMMRFCEDELRRRGFENVEIWYLTGKEHLKDYYASLGYEFVRTIPDKYAFSISHMNKKLYPHYFSSGSGT